MKRIARLYIRDCFVVGLASLMILGLGACRKTPKSPPKVVFAPMGLEISGLPEKTPVKLYDASGKLLLAYPPLPSRDLLLIFPWQPRETYYLVAKGFSLRLQSPNSRPLAEIEVFAPLGSPGRRFLIFETDPLKPEEFVILSKDPCPEIGFLITSFVSELPVHIPPLEKNLVLSGEFDRYFFHHRICLAPEVPHRIPLITGKRRLSLTFKRMVFDLKGKVKLVSWRMPTEESGYTLRYRREGLLVVPNPLFERLGYLLGIKSQGFSRYAPFAYQTLVLKNFTGAPLNLLVKADFLAPETGKPVPGFYPPRFGMIGHFKKPLALVYLPPHGNARVVLPIYMEGVSPGEYVARVEVYPLGEEKPLFVKERQIGVTRGSPRLATGLLIILTTGLLYSGAIFLALRRLLSGFNLRELSLVALAGAVAFGLDFLGGLLSNILYAFLGPFNILVGGLVTEVVHYAVFTAVLAMVPKPGFATLSGLLHYLMGLTLFGGLRATDPFFLGARLFVLEACLFLFRGYHRPWSGRTILALGIADAINTLSSLVLHMTFYRLFFPGWYLWLSLLVKGFLYTLIGAWIGARMGKHLLGMER